jgi:hypothetical protein
MSRQSELAVEAERAVDEEMGYEEHEQLADEPC